jgi:hypothetical protein
VGSLLKPLLKKVTPLVGLKNVMYMGHRKHIIRQMIAHFLNSTMASEEFDHLEPPCGRQCSGQPTRASRMSLPTLSLNACAKSQALQCDSSVIEEKHNTIIPLSKSVIGRQKNTWPGRTNTNVQYNEFQ